MAVYRIADVNFDIQPTDAALCRRLAPFAVDDIADMKLCITPADIERERRVQPQATEEILYSSACLRMVSGALRAHFDGFMLHSAALCYNRRAALFAAPSGTGKTTHIRLWQQVLGDKVTVINGDKPFVRLRDGGFFVYGGPWQGKENMGNNICCPLRNIYFLKRAEHNRILPIEPTDALPHLLGGTPYPDTLTDKIKYFDLLEKLCSKVGLYTLECNMDISAAELAIGHFEREVVK